MLGFDPLSGAPETRLLFEYKRMWAELIDPKDLSPVARLPLPAAHEAGGSVEAARASVCTLVYDGLLSTLLHVLGHLDLGFSAMPDSAQAPKGSADGVVVGEPSGAHVAAGAGAVEAFVAAADDCMPAAPADFDVFLNLSTFAQGGLRYGLNS